MERVSRAAARFVQRRPWWILAGAVVLAVAMAPGITMMRTETGFSSLISSQAAISQDNARYESQFGAEQITVLLEGRLSDIFSSENLALLSQFEERVLADERYLAVLSPLTMLRAAISEAERAALALQQQIGLAQEKATTEARQAAAAQGLSEALQEQAAQAAREEVLAQFQPQLAQLQQMGEPSLDNPLFVAAVLYDSSGAVGEAIKPLVPDDRHALLLVTPKGNMPDDEALQAAEDIESTFSERPMTGVGATVVADTKLVDAISTGLGQSITFLLSLSVAAMILILLVLFRVRWRLLSLLMVGLGALWTFGLMGYASVPQTMATMAVLPILIGLGIDYSIQFHNRYQEEVTRSKSVKEAIIASASRMLPTVGIALLATIIGFITLYISRVPMVRDFGMMLAVGIILSFLAALFVLHAILYLADRRARIDDLSRVATRASGRTERVLSRIARAAVANPLPVFLIALAFGVAGGVVDQWLPTNTDYEELMPQDIPELRELRELREITGGGGEVRFMVEADDVTSPEVLTWLQGFQDRALTLHPELVSAGSIAVLVSEATGGPIPPQPQIAQILDNSSPLYLAQLLSGDRQMASLSFSTRYASLEETHDLLQSLVEEARPPAGVRISPVGTLALGASTVDAVVATRFTMNLLCLGAVFLVLLLVYRRLSRALFTIIPVGAVIAWSSLDMYLIGIPLNPLTAIMGVIIIGICTEFMVLLMGRYEEEKQQGQPAREAMVTAIAKIGRAIVTTAFTTLGGFGVLIASNFVMIRDFGIATVVGVFLCLVITLTVMPGVIVWFDSRTEKRLAR